MYTGCFKIHEFRIQSMVGKDPVELEKYLEKKNRSSWRRYKHFNFVQYIAATVTKYYSCRSIFKKNLRFFYSKLKLFFKKWFRLLFSTIICTINNNKHWTFQPVFEENAVKRVHLQINVSLWGECRFFFLISIFGLLKWSLQRSEFGIREFWDTLYI
jgi:hypothetical protein